MDADDGRTGYPAMGPIVEPPVEPVVQPSASELEPGPDYLLAVTDARDAVGALDTAERMPLLNGQATVWQVVERLVTGGVFVAWMAAASAADTEPDVPVTGWWLAALPLVALVVVSAVAGRRVGMTLSGRERLIDGLAWAALAVATFRWAVVEPRTRGVVLVVVFALVFALIPVVRLQRANHRAEGVEGWPPGVQAFALLSLLERAGAVAPERLIALAGLSRVDGDQWLQRLRAEHSVFGGRRRHWVRGDERLRLTPLGHERLQRMRVELRRVATGMPVG